MGNLNEEQKRKLSDVFSEKLENVSQDDVKKAIETAKQKIEDVGKDLPDKLESVWQDVKDMWNMLVDYYHKRYTEVPWGTIAAIVVALLYFATPIDLIPDFIPIVGYVDDVFVISLALKFIEKDLEDYRRWRKDMEGKVYEYSSQK